MEKNKLLNKNINILVYVPIESLTQARRESTKLERTEIFQVSGNFKSPRIEDFPPT